MDVKLNSLIPFDKLKQDVNFVFEIVEKNGKVVLLKDNLPVYIIMKYDAAQETIDIEPNFDRPNYTLHEAMKIVLIETEEKMMHAAALADQIYSRGLYKQKNGGKAQYNQLRARCGHYPDMFEALSGNIIKLKDSAKTNI